MMSDKLEKSYPILERCVKFSGPTMPVVLDYGEYHVHALVNTTDKDSISESEILDVYREVHDYDRYPKADGRVGLSSASDNSFLKITRMIYYNPWKFNSKFSIDREIKALETLQHPNIMKLFGLFVEDGFVKGLYVSRYDYTLDQLLKQKIPFDRMKFMLSLVDTVDYIRSQKYVHGDLHEENIMVLKEDTSTPYIIDFDACEAAGTEIIRTTKSFGQPGCNYIIYGCDCFALVDIFKLLFKNDDVKV